MSGGHRLEDVLLEVGDRLDVGADAEGCTRLERAHDRNLPLRNRAEAAGKFGQVPGIRG
jgi:hypothetical protein